jgi:hypothetical protein
VVWSSEECDCPGRLKDVLKVFLRPLSRCDQGLPRSLAHSLKVRRVPYILAHQAAQTVAHEYNWSLVLFPSA